MESRDRQRQRGFQSRNAKRRALKFHLLFVSGMGSVVGGNGIDCAVGNRDQDGFTIGRGAQRADSLL